MVKGRAKAFEDYRGGMQMGEIAAKHGVGFKTVKS